MYTMSCAVSLQVTEAKNSKSRRREEKERSCVLREKEVEET
jgi:hypothetical protein